jgi:hypothetical protein
MYKEIYYLGLYKIYSTAFILQIIPTMAKFLYFYKGKPSHNGF